MVDSFLTTLIKLLRTKGIEYQNAKDVTSEFLSLQPYDNLQEMKVKISAFTEKYPDFRPVYVTFLHYEDTHISGSILTQMKELISSNKLDQALKLVK